MVRTILVLILVLVVVAGVLMALGFIDIRQTREARLPDVQTEGGQMPAFDVDTPDVDVTTKNETVRVPDISIDRREEPEER